jgi:hypothetical protein
MSLRRATKFEEASWEAAAKSEHAAMEAKQVLREAVLFVDTYCIHVKS